MTNEYNELLLIKSNISNELSEYKDKMIKNEGEYISTLRDLKNRLELSQDDYKKYKEECAKTQLTMQEDLKKMFEQSECILNKYDNVKIELNHLKKSKDGYSIS